MVVTDRQTDRQTDRHTQTTEHRQQQAAYFAALRLNNNTIDYQTTYKNTNLYFALSGTITLKTLGVVDGELEWITVTLSVVRH